jgi:hypothetical protein
MFGSNAVPRAACMGNPRPGIWGVPNAAWGGSPIEFWRLRLTFWVKNFRSPLRYGVPDSFTVLI